MKNKPLIISTVTFGVITIALAIILFFMASKLDTLQKDINRKDSIIAEKTAEVTFRTNREGRIIAEKDAAVATSKQIAQAYPEVVKAIEKDFELKFKNMKAYIENQFAAHGQGQGSVVTNNYYDSAARKQVRFRDFTMDDGFLQFNTRLYDSLSSALYEYTYSDTATTVFSTNKQWYQVWKKEKYFASTMFKNPNAKITGTKNILVDSYRDKRWNVSVGVTAYPSFEESMKIRFAPGLHVGWTLIKF